MKRKIFVLIALILLTGVSCKKFLQVDPKSSLGADELFSSEEGFKQALTGVYSQMAARDLYGEQLTMSFVSVLAQNYNALISPNFIYRNAAYLDYTQFDATGPISRIWSKSYNAIAGVNNVLAKIDDKKTLFAAGNYEILKAEALGLRAYIHFDLLRLFGANFSTNPNKKAIPYRVDLSGLSQVPGTVDEVSALILNDLKMAEALIKDKESITGDRRRRFRMNYYALKALQARVYLFRGDKENARAAAQEVVNSPAFKLIEPSSVTAPTDVRDRTFSTEQIFALRVRDMRTWVQEGSNLFNYNSNGFTSFSALLETDFKTLYESSSTDIRYINLRGDVIATHNSRAYSFSTKHWQTWVLAVGKTENDRLDQNVSLIRLSEMYYILAETAVTPAEGVAFLNVVREKRALSLLPSTITPSALTAEITKEYQKDFYAEGQLFYYYKRNQFVRMQFLNRDLTEANYILPIPVEELEYNPNYN